MTDTLTQTKQGAVMVVGGGIGGIQASLDLAEMGYYVYLIEESPAIGGRMAQLDKTFPTNDCAMCMLSPKLVEVGRHPNVQILTQTTLAALTGAPGNFLAKVRQRPRYVDISKCIACGQCATACVYQEAKFPDEYNAGMSKRKPAYLPYPQAIPRAAVIDPETCIYFKSGRCPQLCEKNCPRGAIDFAQKATEIDLNVGAVLLAPGLEPYDAQLSEEYGFGRYPNVLTATQFERTLSASGPTLGKVLRPSDGRAPKKVAFIQCVGSRDVRHLSYCSAVCCMYTTKEAIVAKEHDKEIEPTIFYIDLRAYGKNFSQLVQRAKDQGVRYVRSMISQIVELPETNNLVIRYRDAHNLSEAIREEEFDLAVLSVGIQPSAKGRALAQTLGIELNSHGFARTKTASPVESSRKGVFVTGAFTGPKDIPETVIQASAAAAAIDSLIASARGTRVQEKEYPHELTIDEEPRVGVFVCHCGSNIGGVVNVKSVADYAQTLPGVVHSENVLYTCSQDNLKHMKELIQAKRLNRVVVASCTPRNLETLFQDTIREAGLNKFLFEMVNIREQCSWVHSDQPERATEKAKSLVSMGVAKSKQLEPLASQRVTVTPKALVIGGGVSGMTAALSIANSGFETHLIEKRAELGYDLRELYRTLDDTDVQQLRSELIAKIRGNPRVRVHTEAITKEIVGFVGNYLTRFSTPQGEQQIDHGIVIVAAEAEEHKPIDYLYGTDTHIFTQRQLERLMQEYPGTFEAAKTIVMIQCVGRNEQRPYCSRVCCGDAIKNALKLLEEDPERRIYVLFHEMMAYGLIEDAYRQAREKGIVFLRHDEQLPPQVHHDEGRLFVRVRDARLNKEILIEPDLLVLSTGLIPDPQNEELGRMLKIPVDAHGFFVEAHVKLRPVDFASHGIFVCGASHAPGTISELIAKAQAAAGRAVTILSKSSLEAGSVVAVVDAEKCTSCLTCLRECPYGAIFMNAEGIAEVKTVKCQGCGICAADCPAKAIQLRQFQDAQELSMVRELLVGAGS
jgi:heterodisulfide reductase subunit A